MDDNKDEDTRTPAPSPYLARDPEALARNVARAVEEGGRALAAYLAPREQGQPAAAIADAATDVVKTLGKVGEYWASDPARLMDAQQRLISSYLSVWRNATERSFGDATAPAVKP